jgi:hypothetical protein
MTEKSKSLCLGCRSDFYNKTPETDGECWSYEKAQVVTRYRIGWWVEPTVPGAHVRVETLHCHHAPGKYAHRETLPDFAKP